MTLAIASPATASPANAIREVPPQLVSVETPMMGGTVGIHLRPLDEDPRRTVDAGRAASATSRRMQAWADRLTRFTDTSDLARLNASTRHRVAVGPTLAAVLDWARQAEGLSDGIVDVALLDERLDAERGADRSGDRPATTPGAYRSWSMDRGEHATFVRRDPGLRLDLDGVAKGWLADRALARLDAFPAAVVDADGDVAIRLGPGQRWRFGVADPRTTDADLVELDLVGPTDADGGHARGRFGLATSGTSVHRWVHDGRAAHHLIDPRTGLPAKTDVVQATVLAGTARAAEAFAKTAVILGSEAALRRLDRPGVDGLILLTDRDELLLSPSTLRWLA
jgi:thiamine biosynthesis lipoprotein